MAGSTITVFAVNASTGANGAQLGTTTTSPNGSFSLTVAPQTGPVRVTAGGGTYTSEMNGATINSPGQLSVLLANTNTPSPQLSLNPLSTFVDSRSVGLIKGGTAFSTALTQATAQIEAIYGLGSDPGSLVPSYTTTGTDAANLGLILGAMINEDQYLCPGSPGGLVTALAADISDGVFDGTTTGTPVPYCTGNLPAIAGTIDFQDASSALAQLDNVTAAFVFGGTGNILTTNGLANLALNGLNTYPIAPLATINQAIVHAAPSPVSTFAPPSAVPTMTAARYDAASALLPHGDFLVAGGGGSSGAFLSSIEIYDPATNKFAISTPAMNSLRANEVAALLPNGKVLIAGGAVNSTTWTNTTDVYNPVGNTISAGPTMTFQREGATATLLPNGKVLIAGGRDSTTTLAGTDLYDPVANTITTGPSMNVSRYDCAVALLPNGKVLIAGGFGSINQGGPLRSTEIYDPSANTFAAGPQMTDTRGAARATLLPNGKVLIAGGTDALAVVNTTDLYDPTAGAVGSFTAGPNMVNARKFHTQVLLPNGKVLLAGGYANNLGTLILSSTELYDPTAGAVGSFASGPSMNGQRGLASGALLANGKVLIAGGASIDAGIHSTVDLYTP